MRDEQKTKQQLIEELKLLRESFSQLEQLVSGQQAQREVLQQQKHTEGLITQIAGRISQSLDLSEILNITVKEVQQFLQAERVFVYRFQADWSGQVIAESTTANATSILGRTITDSYFADANKRRLYEQNRIHTIADIYTAGLSTCHIDLLASLEIRANLVVPILQAEQLWGFLIANQCQQPRQWQQWEIGLLEQLATQLSIAIQQSQLYQRTQQLWQREQALNRVIKSIRNSLDLDTIFSTGVKEVAQLIQAQKAVIVQYLPQQQEWLHISEYRQSPNILSDLGTSIPDVGNKIAERLKRLELVQLDDPANFGDKINRQLAQGYDGAWLLIPIHFNSQVWGSLSLLRNKQSLPWHQEDIELAKTVADQLSIAIEQSTLVKQLQTELIHRQQAEAAVQQKQHFVQKIVETTPDIIYIYDLVEKRNVYINHQMVEILGYSSNAIQTLKEQVLPNLIHPDDIDRVNTHLQSFKDLLDGEVLEIEYRMKHINRDWLWLHSRECVFARDENGHPLQILGTASDITEQKQVQESLRKSEEQLRLVLDLTGTGCWDWNVTTDEVVWSEQHYHLLGLPPNSVEPSYQNWLAYVHPQDIDHVEKAINSALDHRTDYQVEYRVIHPDGSHHWLIDRGRGLYNSSGQAIRMIGMVYDISERKLAELTLWQTQQQLQAILDNSPVPIYLIDSQNKHILVSRSYAKLLSTTSQHLIGKNIYEFWAKEAADAFTTNNQQVLQANQAIEVEETVSLAQELFTYISIKFPLHDANSIPYAVCGISTDVTGYKQAQQKISEQAALIDVATDAILVHDLEKRILFWNRGAECLYGWTATQCLGQTTDDLFCRSDISLITEALRATVEQGFWQGELEQITKTGKQIIVASRWTLVHNQFGHSQSILIVNTDITHKKQLEQQFYRTQRLESVGTLASGIAHDLNNVFAPIVMIANLLPFKCKNTDAKTQELFQTLETSAQRGANLVKQILTFTRGTGGQKILVQPAYLLNELVKVIKATFPKSIEIITNIPINTLWMVQADPTQLEQVFMNLAVNARDAMPNGGLLTIRAENRLLDHIYAQMHLDAKAGEYIVVTVADTGSGIPAEFLERIFDPFFTTKEVGKGTGLGLSTVLGIVKNYGGFVDVSTQVGKGTQFQVFLPRHTGTATKTMIKTESFRGNGELILIVDDEASLQRTTQQTLTDYNYKTLVANDGIEAIALYAEHRLKINAVLLDMSMPNMDGFTAILTLKTLNPKVKIIAISGLPDNEANALAVGANRFLSKPYTAIDLLSTLFNVIRTGE